MRQILPTLNRKKLLRGLSKQTKLVTRDTYKINLSKGRFLEIDLTKVSPSQKISKQELFKSYLRKIGSGQLTGKAMSRMDAANAMLLMLKEEASPAQIGAFMIAHRIRRPEPEELAGMIDTYLDLGPTFQSEQTQCAPICFGMPFDGRKRIAPIYPLTTLLLLSAGQPVVLQGGKRMPVKYGVTTLELFIALGLNLQGLSLSSLEQGFQKHGFALIHQPDHFPLADNLISYRDEIGKRPPLASMELLWTCHKGKHLLISSFVHPPTEDRSLKTLQILGEENVVTIKGLEGSTDLPISRACITSKMTLNKINRIILHPREHHCHGLDEPWKNIEHWKEQAINALNNRGPLKQALRWNAGVYLWFAGKVNSLDEGIEKAKSMQAEGVGQKTLETLVRWSQKH